jgi:MFS family permease
MNTRQSLSIGLAVAGGMTLHAMMYGPQAAFITEQFPPRVRYAGSSLAYTLTGVVAGGFAPLIFTALYRAYGSTVRLSIYLTIALVLTLIALWSAGETSDRSPAARSHPPVT